MIGSLSYQVHPGAEFSSVGAVTLGDNWVANHLFTVACSIVAGKHPVLLALQSFTRRWVLAAVSSEREKTTAHLTWEPIQLLPRHGNVGRMRDPRGMQLLGYWSNSTK